MNKKSIFIFALICVFSLTLLPSAQAGSTQRHRWEGVFIGLGAAILGNALLHQHQDYAYHRHVWNDAPGYGYYPPRHHHRRGHWEIRKEWIPPTYRQVWNPGHYNRYGEWVPGGWVEIIDRPGYWVEKRVWVAYW